MIELTEVVFMAGEPFGSGGKISLSAGSIDGVSQNPHWPYRNVRTRHNEAYSVTETYDEIMAAISREEDRCPRNAPDPSSVK